MSKTLATVAVVTFLLTASTVLADGCYIPERAVRKIPEIAAQQAVLSWKDGVERLVISSALDSEAQKLGWIIPVPSVPGKIEKATPGTLKTLGFCIQPRITHDLSRELRALVLVVFVVTLLVATWFFKQERFTDLLVLLFLLFMLSALLLPAAGTAGAGMATRAPTVHVEKTGTVGSYTISILRPSRPDGLDSWLSENGFTRLPKAAGPIIADYISRGWVFAAIKLTRDQAGASVPHPIELVFPSKQAIYPMKLTAVAGGSPVFELFVIGADRAACDALPLEFCDRFTKQVDYSADNRESPVWYDGASTRCRVGHSAICSLMWDNCVLTKLSGTIASASMTKDLSFSWKPFESHQEHFFTQYGAGCLGTMLFVVLAGAWNIVSMRDYARGRVQPKRFTSYAVKRLLPAVALGAIGGGCAFAILPKLGGSEVQVSRGWAHREYLFPREVWEALSKNPAVLTRTDAEIAAFLSQTRRNNAQGQSAATNMVTGADLIVEDSPGNFTVERTPAGGRVRVYDRFGGVLMEGPPPIPALIELLKDKDDRVRLAALETMQKACPGAEIAIPTLMALLRDNNGRIRSLAAKALGQIGPAAHVAIPALAKLFREREEIPGVCVWWDAAKAVGRIGRAAIPALTESLKDDDDQVRLAAVRAVGSMNPDAKLAMVPALTTMLKDKDQQVAMDAAWTLGEIGPPAIPALTQLLKDKDSRIRWNGAVALAEIGPKAKAALPALTELLKDNDSDLREAAAKAIERINLTNSTP